MKVVYKDGKFTLKLGSRESKDTPKEEVKVVEKKAEPKVELKGKMKCPKCDKLFKKIERHKCKK